jgi:hypothetical protein
MRIRFGFSGLVNIQRQLGNIRREPPRLILSEQLAGNARLYIQQSRQEW